MSSLVPGLEWENFNEQDKKRQKKITYHHAKSLSFENKKRRKETDFLHLIKYFRLDKNNDAKKQKKIEIISRTLKNIKQSK